MHRACGISGYFIAGSGSFHSHYPPFSRQAFGKKRAGFKWCGQRIGEGSGILLFFYCKQTSWKNSATAVRSGRGSGLRSCAATNTSAGYAAGTDGYARRRKFPIYSIQMNARIWHMIRLTSFLCATAAMKSNIRRRYRNHIKIVCAEISTSGPDIPPCTICDIGWGLIGLGSRLHTRSGFWVRKVTY